MNNTLRQLFLATLVILSSQTSLAQASDDDKQPQWYQIELLVFAYQNTEATNLEIWPQSPGLNYPQRIVELTESLPTEVLLNNTPRRVTQFSDGTASGLETEASPASLEESYSETSTASPAGESVDDEATLLDSDASTDRPAPLLVQLDQQPFTLLDATQQGFKGSISRLTRQADIRTLFHGVWRQPIAERDQAESILIRGGDQFDNHYELEGSISLGLERYLHIKTDLWLSTFVSAIGQEKKLWQVLPPHPITSSHRRVHATADPFSFGNRQQRLFSGEQFDNPFSALADNQYSVDQTVVLRQERRMRSGELHYIDHPLMGLLIKISPYEFPEAEAPVTVTPDAENPPQNLGTGVPASAPDQSANE